jgi:septum site-determining protein MinC
MKHDETVIFKGSKEGIHIVLSTHIDYMVLREKLRNKLQESAEFFYGAKVIVDPGNRELQPVQYHEISDILQKEFGLILVRWETNEKKEYITPAAGQAAPANGASGDMGTLIVYRTIRSGQVINYRGSVVVLGDVNPGASVVADGDITVLGIYRGTAHAGANGNLRATVAAYRLQPTKLRIADLVACAPDGAGQPTSPEIARIKEGQVIVETANLRSRED